MSKKSLKSKQLLKNGLIVTADSKGSVFKGDLLIGNDRILDLGPDLKADDALIIDASPYLIIPGLIQTHVHLCQTLFRNLADDLPLLEWLQHKIWPYEAAHTPETLRLSARLGICELLMGGTTTILDMGTVHHMDVVFEELTHSGIRGFSGKTMMDYEDTPAHLFESTDASITSSVALLERWHGTSGGRVQYAFAPRFLLSCTKDLLSETGRLAEHYDVPFHTHAAESVAEVQILQERYGKRSFNFMEQIGIARPNSCVAHCIWVDHSERAILKQNEVKVLHCPSSNLKLGSGIAPVPEYLEMGIHVSLGADGAPCNNNLDQFTEMRLAALIQKPKYGPDAMDAETVFRMATIEGARALGIADITGSLEIGKKADITFIRNDRIPSIPFENVYSKLVYSTSSAAVEHVIIDGAWVLKNRVPLRYSIGDIIGEVNQWYQKTPVGGKSYA
jgi:5-methylthioadenosine/S-adenosylhomocysteine deaminase